MVIHARGQNWNVQKKSGDTVVKKYDSLRATIVTAVIRPKMKGDTIEYNTANILLRSNEVVESLLQRLPGLSVAPDGTITYNGEKIQHLLVDGEDVFMDNPTLVTRSFDANKIARIQILDRRSDQSLFAGVDDGTRTKTLNLVMKEDAKSNFFGNVGGGGNTSGYYNVSGVLSLFHDREQLMGFGVLTNTGVAQSAYTGGGVTAGTGFLFGVNDPLGASAGIGIPRYTSEAGHYANGEDNFLDHILVNFGYGHSWSHPVTTTQTVQTEPDTLFDQYQQSQSISQLDQESIHGIYDLAISPVSAIRLNFQGSISHMENQFGAVTSSVFNDALVNSSQRTIHDQTNRHSFSGDVSWRTQTGRQAGNMFSMTFNVLEASNSTSGYLYSPEYFYQPNGNLQSADTIDQRKEIVDHNLVLGSSVSYTRKVWKGTKLAFSYGLSGNWDVPFQGTYDKEEGYYQQIVDSLSSSLSTLTLNQHEMITLQGDSKPISYIIGADRLDYCYQQHDLIEDSIFKLHYINWNPRISVNLTPNPTFNVYLNLNSSTQLPSIAQMEPIRNNSNPLIVTLGNPNLKLGTSRNLVIALRWLKAWIMNLNLNVSLIDNSISTKTTLDSLGRQISQPMNVNGGRTVGFNFSVDHKLAGVDWNFHTVNTYSRTANYINSDLNETDAYTFSGGISVGKYVPNEYSIKLITNFSYLNSRNSINITAPTSYWIQSHSGSIIFYYIRNYEFGSNATYTWQQKTSELTANTSVLLWDAYVSRSFLNHKLELKAMLNNILDENSGVTRSISANISTETTTNILGRYWMFKAVYYFDKKLKKK